MGEGGKEVSSVLPGTEVRVWGEKDVSASGCLSAYVGKAAIALSS